MQRDMRAVTREAKKRALRSVARGKTNGRAPDGAPVRRQIYLCGERTVTKLVRNNMKAGDRRATNMQLRAAKRGDTDADITGILRPNLISATALLVR
jgi:hypothetical protein